MRAAVRSVALVALLALARVHADDATEVASEIKITASPALKEAMDTGEVDATTAFTAAPVTMDINWSAADSGSSDEASAASATPTAAPETSAPIATTKAPTISPSETAVDTFKAKGALESGSSGKGSAAIIVVAACACVAAVVIAVMVKRKSNKTREEDEAEQQRRTTTCMFETGDYTPGKMSMDGMLQDDRMTTGSSAMLPVFSAEDRMDVSAGVVRLSSPFGAKGVRISSPGGGPNNTTENMEFSVDPKSHRGGSGLSFGAPSTDSSTQPPAARTDTQLEIRETASGGAWL